ncbi:phage holin family protein [bacterium]|nr:phage holin family protein [bacterium]
MSQLGYDLLTLAELQFKLLRLDLSKSARRAVVVFALISLSAVLILCASLLLLAGLSYEISRASELPLAASLSIVGGSVLLLGVIFGGFALNFSRPLGNLFKHSGEELRKNIETIKNGLLNG